MEKTTRKMTESKQTHTPGPWYTSKRFTPGWDSVFGNNGEQVAHCHSDNTNPDEYKYGVDQETCRANAALIAAAPDMYAAARALFAVPADTISAKGPAAVALKALLSAIRKAEGGAE